MRFCGEHKLLQQQGRTRRKLHDDRIIKKGLQGVNGVLGESDCFEDVPQSPQAASIHIKFNLYPHVTSELLSFIFNSKTKDERLPIDEAITKLKLPSELKVKLQPLCILSDWKAGKLKTYLLHLSTLTFVANSRERVR